MSASTGTPRSKARNVGKESASPTSTVPFTAPPAMWTPEAIRNLDARHATAAWATNPSHLTRFMKEDPPWTWFMTMTFRPPGLPPHLAMSAGQRLTRWCSAWRTFRGGREETLFRCLLWSAEEHKTGLVHLHALSVTTPGALPTHCPRCHESSANPLWKTLKESWWQHWGISRVFPYNPKLAFGAEAYVTKYILKPTCLDWGLEEW